MTSSVRLLQGIQDLPEFQRTNLQRELEMMMDDIITANQEAFLELAKGLEIED
ncbi:hypothetical protein [Anaerospora hongkongensis]|uniref:hypothetical protein n=1 Tax=Anaerospora hongkongensis TaxID=244830 RepID=UPI00289F08DD|nr:hypothetical protein [Anaerospora hongkongensis]